MLNLEEMLDEEFCVPVRPRAPYSAAQIAINEKGYVSLSGRLAEQFAKRPVQIRFNAARTAIQITCTEETNPLNIVFSQNGRKHLPDAYELLKQKQVSFPVIFSNSVSLTGDKWRGALSQNPTLCSAPATRSKKKK